MSPDDRDTLPVTWEPDDSSLTDEPTSPGGLKSIPPASDIPDAPEALRSLLDRVLVEQANERSARADEHATSWARSDALAARIDALTSSVQTLAYQVASLTEELRHLRCRQPVADVCGPPVGEPAVY